LSSAKFENIITLENIKSIWKPFLNSSRFKVKFLGSLIILAGALLVYRRFLDFAEARTGVPISDPILKLYEPIDLTWLIFGLIYLCLVVGILILIKHPDRLLLAFQTYTAIIIVRIIAMYLMPFEAPEKLIVLNDPFVEMFGSSESLTKDLFFSGHTATLFLLFLVVESKRMRYIFLTCGSCWHFHCFTTCSLCYRYFCGTFFHLCVFRCSIILKFVYAQ